MRRFAARAGNPAATGLNLARVLLVHGDLESRLTLETILRAGGYSVDAAATPAEALAKLDSGRYSLVLTESQLGTRYAARNVLAYARVKEYHPATGVITSGRSQELRRSRRNPRSHVAIHTENLPLLLGKVAELIGIRAIRRARPLRQAV